MERSWRDEHGQELVEFALVAPVLLLFLFGIIEFGRVIFTYNTLSNAAREGARCGIIGSADDAAVDACARRLTSGLNPDPSELVIAIDRGTEGVIEVSVSYDVPLLVGNIIAAAGGDADIPLTAVARMRIE